MKKIPSLFIRAYEVPQIIGVDATNHNYRTKKGRFLATPEVTPGCEWVLAGEGIATRKWDGTAVMIESGLLYKRYDAKQPDKVPPIGFRPCQQPDPDTGHWPGWLKTDLGSKEDKYLLEAYFNYLDIYNQEVPDDGTYEAIGHKINGNSDGALSHVLQRHGNWVITKEFLPDRNFDTIKEYLSERRYEGIVFHHPDGRMCKVKRSDFGLKWPIDSMPNQ